MALLPPFPSHAPSVPKLIISASRQREKRVERVQVKHRGRSKGLKGGGIKRGLQSREWKETDEKNCEAEAKDEGKQLATRCEFTSLCLSGS